MLLAWICIMNRWKSWPYKTPLPPHPQEHNPVKLLGRINIFLTNLQSLNSKLYSNTVEVRVECWTCPWEQGWAKSWTLSAKLSVNNWNAGKSKKAKSRSGAKSQHPRWTTITKQRSGEAQSLKAGMGQQDNLPEEPLTLNRGQKRHKGWELGYGGKQPS
jgi:hypothetical protein